MTISRALRALLSVLTIERRKLRRPRRGQREGLHLVRAVCAEGPNAFPMGWQITTEEAHRRINLLAIECKYRAVDVHWHEPDVSLVEAMMSRGGREVWMSSKPPGATARALTRGPSFSRLIRGERRANAASIWKARPRPIRNELGLPWITFRLAHALFPS